MPDSIKTCMQNLKDLTALVEKYAAAIPDLNPDSDELEGVQHYAALASEPSRDRRTK